MKNRRKSLITVIGSALFIALATTGISVAWFTSVADLSTTNTPIGGVVQDTYYESGDGSAESPYVITRPRHLYNLAWLQDLGFYNKHDGSEDDHQFYFKLGDNIDMSSFGPIPPIGTEKNPFVGNFDGQGFVISGITISNDFNDYNSHPSVISGWNGEVLDQNDQPIEQPINKPHILGLFGVVGDYTNANKPTVYSSAVNEFKNTGITGATIRTSVPDSLMGVAAGYVNGNMSNVLVDVSTVDVSDDIVGNTTSYGGFTQNISDYTLVGYTQNTANVKKAEQSIYDVEITSNKFFNAVDQANDEGWGGSINMKTIYYRLASLRKTKSTNVAGSFAWRVEDTYYNGVVNQSEHATHTALTTSQSPFNTGSYYSDGMSRYVGANETGHEYIGNYNIYARAISQGYPNTGGSADQQFLYLSGGHYENRTYRTYYEHTGYPITDGTHYLNVYLNANSVPLLSEGTDSSNCINWNIPSTATGIISYSFIAEGVTAYLTATNNSLDVTDDSSLAVTWNITRSDGKLIISTGNNGRYHLKYDNGWILRDINATADVYFYIYTTSGGNTRYVSSGSQTYYLAATTSRNSAIKWYWDDTYHAFYYLREGNSRYLMLYSSNNNYYAIANASKTADSYFIRPGNSTSTPTATQNSVQMRYSNYRMKYNNSNDNGWTMVTNNYNTFTVEMVSNPIDVTDNVLDSSASTTYGPDYHQTADNISASTNNSHMYYTPEDTTYFPLNVGKDIESYISNTSTMNSRISNGDLDPKDSNTGYIVSGSTIASNLETLTSASSNIRISEYTISDVDASFNKTAGTTSTIADLPDSSIYTINLSGSTVTMNTLDTSSSATNYPRYSDSKTSFYQNSLTTAGNNGTFVTNSYVYGLHFMPSTISKQSIVNGNKVNILGNKSDNYELPVDCIDFNLKQKGVINFFAGTYFSNNDSFFSLYQIIRNDDAVLKNGSTNDYTSYKTINDIKEIVAVYSNDVGTKTTKYSNIYKYKTIVNGNPVYTYSEPYRFDGNLNKFKMDKNSTADLTTAYTDNYEMSQSDFNAYVSTYGYTQRLDSPTQIGKQASAYTTNRIYYFEIPMNSGEYCLGSVDGGTGAYLLYLDIGANAARTERTIFYEHFTVDEHTFSYPLGVSLNDLGDPVDYPCREAVIDITEVVDPSDSACMRIIATAKGEFTIDRNSNSVALTRANTNKAPPVYASDTITRIYDRILNSSGELVSEDDIEEIESLTSHTYNIKRMEYYDYNVNLEYLTVTRFIDYGEPFDDDDDPETPPIYIYSRGYVSQTVYSGDTTDSSVTATYKYYITDPTDDQLEPTIDQRDNMKIYSTTNGVKYASDDILDTSTIVIDDTKMSDDLILSFRLFQDGGNTYEDVTSIKTHVDLQNTNGKYYLYDYYIVSFVPTSGSTITIKITHLETGETIYYETTLITGSGQEIVEGPQP